jgi:polyisoprenoid-binding protein YceI
MHRLLLAGLLALAAPAAAPPSTFRIDPAHSTIVYAMEHPAHSWTGTSRRVSGALQVDDAGRVTGGDVAAPVASFDSGNRSRDSHMVEATEAYLYRDVRFHLTGVTPTAEAEGVAEGALTFHGVTRPLRVPVRIERAADGLHVRGHFEATLTEFGVERPSLLMVRVRDWIGVTFDLTARPA